MLMATLRRNWPFFGYINAEPVILITNRNGSAGKCIPALNLDRSVFGPLEGGRAVKLHLLSHCGTVRIC